MALLHTPQKDEKLIAPAFTLKNIDNRLLSLKDIQGPKGTVVAFICNHCPYVLAIIERMVEDFEILQSEGIGCAAIMPNDVQAYPDDSFENMKIFSQNYNFNFPYLIDETQEVARAYGAICTPDIFGFNAEGALHYRGRLDSAGAQAADAQTVRELHNAMRHIINTGAAPDKQNPSMGCSIKWA